MKKPEGYFSENRMEMLEFLLPDTKKVLDAGCGEGAFGRLVKSELDAEVWGIEMDEVSSVKAEKVLDRIFKGRIEDKIKELPNRYFDAVVFNDVLEHLENPWEILELIKSKLSEKGAVICSIPNVLHISVIKNMVFQKDWKYEDFGVLDRTHIRFFTKKSIQRMFKEINYNIDVLKPINPLNSLKFLAFNILTIGFFKESNYLQFAVRAKPK